MVSAAGWSRITSAITIVYIIITPDVGETKHGLITKIPDKFAFSLRANYNVDTNSILNSGNKVSATVTLTISFLHCTPPHCELFHRNQKDVRISLVYKVHKKGDSDNTAPFPHNHPCISSCKLQFAEIFTAATYVGMVMWEWCCIITTT